MRFVLIVDYDHDHFTLVLVLCIFSACKLQIHSSCQFICVDISSLKTSRRRDFR